MTAGPSIRTIQLAVCRQFDISLTDLISLRRDARSVRPRHVAMFLAREMTRMSLPEIGRYFGDRDHTTIINAISRVRSYLETEPAIALAIEALKATIAGMPDPESPDLQEMIAEVEREVALRRQAYPRWVIDRRISQTTADRQILTMEHIASYLKAELRAARSSDAPRLPAAGGLKTASTQPYL